MNLSFSLFNSWPMNAPVMNLGSETVTNRSDVSLTSSLVLKLNAKLKLFNNPTSNGRSSFKAFAKEFRALQQVDWAAAYRFGVKSFDYIPSEVHWRICLEMADLCKRRNLVNSARKWFCKVNGLQPFASQGWLEYAKLEEEAGELSECRSILETGLSYCSLDEGLLIKRIRLEEAIGDVLCARRSLSQVCAHDLDSVWKIVFEGALMESRKGKVSLARAMLRCLMNRMPWYGPVFCEAFKLEERMCNHTEARKVVDKALKKVPRYGPLWFASFRLYERFCTSDHSLKLLRKIYSRSVNVISKELVWKVYFEQAQMEDRLSNLDNARCLLVKAVEHSPPNLRWRIWLQGSRLELKYPKRSREARLLLQSAVNDVPYKLRSVLLVERARVEEFYGNISQARTLLQRGRIEVSHDWKVFLESILLEVRCGEVDVAIKLADAAVKLHSGTGRLWAILIHLLGSTHDHYRQFKYFQLALSEVPKSGEVWCEGARMALNPVSIFFNLKAASRYLNFALKFTPQYGDTFVEFLRLEMLASGPDDIPSNLALKCVNADPNYGAMWFRCKQNDFMTPIEILHCSYGIVAEELYTFRTLYQHAMMRNLYQFPHCDLPMLSIDSDWCKYNMNKPSNLYPSSHGLDYETRHRILFGVASIID